MICDDLLKSLKDNRSPLLLTERTEHLHIIAELLADKVKNIITLKGGMGKKQRDNTDEQLKNIGKNEERLILATGRYIGEGFDDARLDTLFLALPISWKGTIQQYAGRLHRQYDGKKKFVFMIISTTRYQCWRECIRKDSLAINLLDTKLMNLKAMLKEELQSPTSSLSNR